jgi:hypothetical protein
MIIVRLLLPSLLVGFATTNFTPGAGADIVMESIWVHGLVPIAVIVAPRLETEIRAQWHKVVEHGEVADRPGNAIQESGEAGERGQR